MLLSEHEKKLLITGYVRAIANVANDYQAPPSEATVRALTTQVTDLVERQTHDAAMRASWDSVNR